MHLAFLVFLSLAGSAASAENDLPAYLLQLPDGVADIYVADTDAATLYRYSQTEEGLRLAESTYMSIGENGAGKEREWDRKTPLGIYFVVDRLDTSRMHEKYGVMAFPLDYPNVRDRHAGRSGNGIWLHGVQPGGQRRPAFDTDGCVAVPNEDLTRLQDTFVPAETAVIVTRGIRRATEADRMRITRELRDAVSEWARALALEDPSDYLALYSSAFTYRGLSYDEWLSFRNQGFRDRGPAQVSVGDLMLLAEPDAPGVYLSRFRQRIVTGRADAETVKRLYWRRDTDGRLKIVAEDNG